MVDKWNGKVAVVTGSSSGIGAAVFKDFLKNGIKVIGLDIDISKTNEVIKSLCEGKENAFAFQCNVADQKSVKETFRKVEEKFEVVNIIVNCAGIGR